MALVELPIEKAFTLIESGPIILLTTHDKDRHNIMTNTWHMVIDFTPQFALMTGPWNFSFKALMNTKECVIAIPTVDLAEKAIKIGDCTGAEIDKFNKFNLTPLPASNIKAPLIAECLANIECRVIDYLEPQGIVILEGLRAWIDPKRKERRTIHANGDGTFVIDGKTINLRKFMEDKLPNGV
jgi:flavin reductase (DIM6/NTAB) family NADH-FMN oxidoreductase RutF